MTDETVRFGIRDGLGGMESALPGYAAAAHYGGRTVQPKASEVV